MQIMNLYCIVGFVICMTNIMSMTVIIILYRIPMMDIRLMLLIEIIRIAPEQLQSARTAPKWPLQFGYYSPTIPISAKFQTEHYASIALEYCAWIVSQKSKGTNHYSWTVIVTVHRTVPRQNHSVYCLLSVEKKITFSKSNSLSVILAISWRIQDFL